ncbi:MAG: hypothetical protein NTV94_14690 [Planctomycetota bacterium]|nr:hypothetical protein [Planctomycetota bacterium]
MTAPSATNHGPFSILGLQPAFELDQAAVERAFLRQVARLHPDHAPDTSEDDQNAAVVALNAARDQLLDPERRAGILLGILGGPAPSQDKSLPQGFLLEMLEARQAMEEELAADPHNARPRWRLWALERRSGYCKVLAELFNRAPGNASVLATIRCELNAWRYIERMIEQLDPAFSHGSKPD